MYKWTVIWITQDLKYLLPHWGSPQVTTDFKLKSWHSISAVNQRTTLMYTSITNYNYTYFNPSLFQSARSISNKLLKILGTRRATSTIFIEKVWKKWRGRLDVNSAVMERYVLLTGIKDESQDFWWIHWSGTHLLKWFT